MDIEQIKKINEMSKALKEHGLDKNPGYNEQVASELKNGHMSDPAAQAEESTPVVETPEPVVEPKIEAPVEEAPAPVPTPEVETQEESTPVEPVPTTPIQNAEETVTKEFVDKQIQDNNNNFIEAIEMLKKNIREINEKVEAVTKEFITYRRKAANAANNPISQPNPAPAAEEPVKKTVEEKRDNNASLPDNKDFGDEVSVEKFFYYGKK